MNFPSQRGFTLIELLVVIAIIGSLTGLVASSFVSNQAKARDARRKSDLTQMQRALELFYNDHGHYPEDSSGAIAGCGGSSTSSCGWGAEFRDGNGTLYMDTIPDEKMAGFNYVYNSDATLLRYQIFAHLENENDPVLDRDGNGTADEYSRSCGDDNCNYAVSSPNTDGSASF